jgi:hypothetical protein
VQDILSDLATQQREGFEEKNNDVSANFAYLSATREIALNIKVSLNYFIVADKINIIIINKFVYKKLLSNIL